MCLSASMTVSPNDYGYVRAPRARACPIAFAATRRKARAVTSIR